MLTAFGKPNNIKSTVVGKISKDPLNTSNEDIFVSFDNNATIKQIAAYIGNNLDLCARHPSIYAPSKIDFLKEGDIVMITSEGVVSQLYQADSLHNSLLITERCNSYCLMCSQPPKKENDYDKLFRINSKIITLLPKTIPQIGLTGGEPLTANDYFFKTLELVDKHLPNTGIHVLSNGRLFDRNMAGRVKSLDFHDKIIFGIPLYGDQYQLHDYIVQSKNAFNQTIKGIYNLKRNEIKIEIRIVLVKPLISRLTKICEFIYKNLTFVDHIALMGIENTGFAKINHQDVWIDPYDYRYELEEAVSFLQINGMNVSIYNLPLCVIKEDVRLSAVRSISDWKQSYLDECDECSLIEKCGGVFTTSDGLISDHIKAII